MNVIEKIYYTWMILVIPTSIFGWMFFADHEEEHPILLNIVGAFICLPLVIGLVVIVIWGIIQIWQG